VLVADDNVDAAQFWPAGVCRNAAQAFSCSGVPAVPTSIPSPTVTGVHDALGQKGRGTSSQRVTALLAEINACRVCEASLPLGPRPVVRFSPSARIVMVGQAPGIKVHESGIPWNDLSGKRLREWLDIDETSFYDPRKFAIVPMGMCYPGRGSGGDLPPRPECAPLWHDRIFAMMPRIELTLLIGQYAQQKFLGASRGPTLTETVAGWARHAPKFFALPHPSPRNQMWFKRNPWFEQDVLPALRERVARALQ
jgi:uracil-DNA glycosylase